MREVYMPFNGEMVRAILEGRKTVTHRPVNRVLGIGAIHEFQKSDTPGYDWQMRDRDARWHDLRNADLLKRCPYGQPGDLMCVRETWRPCFDEKLYDCVEYKADGARIKPNGLTEDEGNVLDTMCDVDNNGKGIILPWRPNIHMFKWACRIKRPIISVRAERIQDITEEDAMKEGIAINSLDPLSYRNYMGDDDSEECWTARDSFQSLYNSIYLGAWERNEWSWRIEWEGGK